MRKSLSHFTYSLILMKLHHLRISLVLLKLNFSCHVMSCHVMSFSCHVIQFIATRNTKTKIYIHTFAIMQCTSYGNRRLEKKKSQAR